MRKEYYFTMKTADEIPFWCKKLHPSYITPAMDQLAKKYKDVSILFYIDFINNEEVGKIFIPVKTEKYGVFSWRKEWLKKIGGQLEFDW